MTCRGGHDVFLLDRESSICGWTLDVGLVEVMELMRIGAEEKKYPFAGAHIKSERGRGEVRESIKALEYLQLGRSALAKRDVIIIQPMQIE